MGSGVIDPAALFAHDFGETRQEWASREAILYALGLGLGRNPVDSSDLAFLDERALKVMPTFAVTLGSPGMWIRDPKFGVDFKRLVHIEQDARFRANLPAAGAVVASAAVVSLTDRGEGRGAELVVARRIRDAESGKAYCELEQTLLLRGDGGFGGQAATRREAGTPDRKPDRTASVELSPRAALIYRLSGDWNPLHLDPGFARSAGFERPIMHGLGVYGMAGVAVARACGIEPDRIARLACRFAGIVLPGDRIDFDIWFAEKGWEFVARVGDRPVLDRGILEAV
jgi:acyl dehydratase